MRVVEDLDLLSTLPAADLRAGLGEVIKCGLIADPRILSLVEDDPQAAQDPASPRLAELVERSVAVKARIVGEDLAESGLREVLNYGHTLAHAIEKCEGFTWRHGDAVAVGCVFAAELARELGLLGADEVGLHRRAFASVGLPTAYPRGARLKDLTEAMLSDKKVRGGHLRFVLLDGLQHPVVRAVAPELLRAPAERTGIDVR
ncbi:3-dehydroquinate synthase family protein [Schaalia naturae]